MPGRVRLPSLQRVRRDRALPRVLVSYLAFHIAEFLAALTGHVEAYPHAEALSWSDASRR